MKKLFSFIIATFLSVAVMTTSCRKAQPIEEQQTNIFGLEEAYHPNEAAVIMTLAAIAYVAEGKDVQTIKDSIGILLNDPSLETKGDWELIWGPGITNDNSNLVYVAKYAYAQPATYAIVVRGTSIYSCRRMDSTDRRSAQNGRERDSSRTGREPLDRFFGRATIRLS